MKPTAKQLELLKYMDKEPCSFYESQGWYFWGMSRHRHNLSTTTVNACIKHGWIEKKGDNRYYISEQGKKMCK